MEKKIICTVCPTGCEMTVTGENGVVTSVVGNTSKRGEVYAASEFSDPVRTLPTPVRVTGGSEPLVPVRTEAPVPKRLIPEIMKLVCAVTLEAPVSRGTVVLTNVLDTGVNVVVTGECE